MPQGNAIFHLMPPPFYAYRYVVAVARAPEESIQEMIDSIVDAGPDKRYKIEVMPGVYAERYGATAIGVNMKEYVDVVAPYGRVVIRPGSDVTTAVNMADHCMLQGLQVDMQSMGASPTGVSFAATTDNSYLEDVWITGISASDTGILDDSDGENVIIRTCRIDLVATGYKKTGEGTTWFANNRVKAATNGTDLDIDDGELDAYDNELVGQGTGANVNVGVTGDHTTTVNSFDNTLGNTEATGTCWLIGDDADVKVNSHNDVFTKVTHFGSKRGIMVAYEEPQTYLVHNGMKIQDAVDDAYAQTPSGTFRFTVRVFAGTYTEAVTMEEYVDIVGKDRDNTIITQPAATVVTGADNTMLADVTVNLTLGAGQEGLLLHSLDGVTKAMTVRHVKMTITEDSGTNYGVHTTQAGTGQAVIHMFDLDITADGAGRAVCLYGRGTDGASTIEDCVLNGATYDIEIDQTTLQSYHNTLAGGGWNLTDNASTVVRSHGDFFTTVTKMGAGLGVMTCQEKPNVWRVFNGMEIADAHAAAAASGDTIEVGPGTYIEALAISKEINLVSIGGKEVTTIQQVNANVITLSAAATIDGFTIDITTAADTAKAGIVCADQNAHIRDCVFTQAGLAGYGITVTSGSPIIDHCTFQSGLDDAIRQTGVGGTVVTQCRILSGATNGVNAADGTVTISHSRIINVAGTGLNASASASIIWADHCDITGTTIDINVAASCFCYADGCTYNDVSNLGTFVDLTGCREYAMTLEGDAAVDDWVYLDTGSLIKKADASDITKMPAIGVVVYKPTTTTAKVKNYGYLYCSTQPWFDDWSTAIGSEWWVSEANAGQAEPGMPAVWPQRVGVVLADEGAGGRFKILIGDNLGLVHCNEYLCDTGVAKDEWVFISTTNATCDEALADAALTMPAIGVVVQKISTTLALVKIRGKYAFDDAGTWAAGDEVYISDTVLGAIVEAPPVGGIIQKVAEVYSVVAGHVILELMD